MYKYVYYGVYNIILYIHSKRGWSFYIILQDVDDGVPRCNKVTIMATAGAVKRSPLKIYPRLLYTLPLYNRKSML